VIAGVPLRTIDSKHMAINLSVNILNPPMLWIVRQ
jgi:hypothetical protein